MDYFTGIIGSTGYVYHVHTPITTANTYTKPEQPHDQQQLSYDHDQVRVRQLNCQEGWPTQPSNFTSGDYLARQRSRQLQARNGIVLHCNTKRDLVDGDGKRMRVYLFHSLRRERPLLLHLQIHQDTGPEMVLYLWCNWKVPAAQPQADKQRVGGNHYDSGFWRNLQTISSAIMQTSK